MYPGSASIKGPVSIKGDYYHRFQKVDTINLTPARPGSGYTFVYKGKRIKYDLSHAFGIQEFGARFNIVSDAKDSDLSNTYKKGEVTIKVIEHLISALYLSGISDVDIDFNDGGKKIPNRIFIPVVGSGIVDLYDILLPFRESHNLASITKSLDEKIFLEEIPTELLGGTYEVAINRDKKNITYKDESDGKEKFMRIEDSDTFGVTVINDEYLDIENLNEKPFSIDDIRNADRADLGARPIARLTNPIHYIGLSIINTLKLSNGITPQNYIFARPRESASKITSRMHNKYQSGRNEYTAHTAIPDFPGEAKALCSELGCDYLKAHITLKNTNHIDRMKILKQICKDGIFS